MIKAKPATWVERTFWGPRTGWPCRSPRPVTRVFRCTFSTASASSASATSPPSYHHFADADHLKIDEIHHSRPTQLSETLESTDTISLFLDRSEG